MKNLKLKSLLLGSVLAVALFMSSCDPDELNYIDIVNVNIMSPDATQKMPGDSIHFHINYENTDGGKIHNISVELKKVENDSTIFYFDDHVHEDGTYEYHADYTLPMNVMHSDVRVVAKSWDMGDGNDGTVAAADSVDFHVHM